MNHETAQPIEKINSYVPVYCLYNGLDNVTFYDLTEEVAIHTRNSWDYKHRDHASILLQPKTTVEQP